MARRTLFLIVSLELLLLSLACTKEPPPSHNEGGTLPSITTQIISEIGGSTAKSGGTIESDGGAFITSKGVCWSTSPTPTISNSITNEGSGATQFISVLSDLEEDITYYVRAYATNSAGTAYGNELKFNTKYYLDKGYSIDRTNIKGSYPNEIIIMGDGYTKENFQYGGKFDQDAATAMEALFSVEPYNSYSEYFKIYKVAAYSAESGASVQEYEITRNTAFNTTYVDGTHLTTNTNKVFEYASTIPGIEARLPNTAIILMLNYDRYGGYCYSQIDGAWDLRTIAICPVSSSDKIGSNFAHFTNLVLHEVGGHAFGRLADEYVSAGGSGKNITQAYKDRYLNGLPYGLRPNIDLTGDHSRVKWKHFIGLPGYDGVSTFEGAFVYSYGVWRPEEQSCMINNLPYFNAPSREQIVKRIIRTAAGVRVNEYLDGILTPIPGDPFDFNEFVLKDIVRSPYQ